MSDLPNYVSDNEEDSSSVENEEYGSPLSPSYSPLFEDSTGPKQDCISDVPSVASEGNAVPSRITIEGINGVDLLDFAKDTKNSIVLIGVPSEYNHHSVFEHCSSVVKVAPQKCEKVGKNTFLVVWANELEAQHAATCKYKCGKVSAGGARLHFFYRVTYYTSRARSDSEAQALASFTEAVGIDPVSVNINPAKSCISYYLQCLEHYCAVLDDPKATTIHVKSLPGKPAFYLNIVRSCASTSDPKVHKLQIEGIPPNCHELKLLCALRGVCDPLFPKGNIFGLSVFRYPDSNKAARFGFVHVLGKENADLLRRVDVPCKGGKITFFNARNSNNKRSRE